MGRQGDRQRGFSIVEAVLVVAVVGVLGVGGWFVYQHNRAKVTNAAAGTQTTNQGTQSTTTTGKTLHITEWGVHLSLDSTTASADYYIDPKVPNVAYLSLSNVSGVAPDCAAHKGGLAAIRRLTETEQQAIVSGTTPGIAGTIHIGSYWYSYTTPNASCMTNAATQQAVAKVQPSFNLQNTFQTLAAD